MNDNQTEEVYKADFLWGYEEGSVEEAGYEFANAIGEAYQEFWWNKLLERTKEPK